MIKNSILSFIRLSVLLGFGLISCQSSESDSEIIKVAQQIKSNQCEIQEITKSIDSSWDESIQELANYLPKDLPEQEKTNILNLKNADLIRMFESYDDFQPKGHEIVDSMERKDMMWAERLRSLSNDNQKLEIKMDSLLAEIENPELIDNLASEVEKIKAKDCTK